ncbi:unnamed protein product [Rotaria magnacalcarata]|uniref:Uncharacterized protein n=2 Tax=Rotaria magnacalcarata TaxID=392030 RepID=A0A814XA71_9BILA|nr:unnamed protein product [Rotaria magnacalcarata]CAF3835575.1 unnamed protein product [Rotaria magnacalcarata]
MTVLINSKLQFSIAEFTSNIQSFETWNTSVLLNRTCQECSCEYSSIFGGTNYTGLNCFPNNTCEYFSTFPVSYKLTTLSGARLYFLKNNFPNASAGCVPNITQLITRLQHVILTILNLPFKREGFGYDNYTSNEAVVSGYSIGSIYWFDPFTLRFLQSISLWTSMSIALHNGLLFTSGNTDPNICVLDSQTNNPSTNITHSSVAQTRKYIFNNNGETMIATGQSVMSLAIFQVNSLTNYTFQVSDMSFFLSINKKQLVAFPFPALHSIAKVNNTLLYSST